VNDIRSLNRDRVFISELNDMDIPSIALIYFSPTKTTQHVVEAIAQGLPKHVITLHDLTPPDVAIQDMPEFQNTLAIIGAPVYGGRIPLEAVHRLQRLQASNTPGVVVVVYGNRAYEDALLELRDIAIIIGFTPIAGGAFIGEHSFTTEATPLAVGRPDQKDLTCAQDFGREIYRKLKTITHLDDLPLLEVPGNNPYKEPGQRLKMITPVTRIDDCTLCSTCASVCPMNAITVNTQVSTNASACILCAACVKQCPTHARIFEHPLIHKISQWLYTNCSERQKPETYL
jgi:ferredoxin/flavodoxin